MKVEIWSDYACPFCYIGKRKFEAALESFPHRGEIEVVYKSFELDPNAKRDIDTDIHTMLSSKYGMSRDQAIAMNANVGEQARSVGLDFRFDTMVLTNTFDAHRLTQYAQEHGLGHEMSERLFHAYFTESKHLGDRETLVALAAEVGLDPAETAEVLAGHTGSQEVRADEQEAQALGVRGVPFYVINRKYGVSGAQPTEVFAEALDKAWSEENPLILMNEGAEGICEDGFCGVSPEPKVERSGSND
jgi:predicted DsbA family dithiol-disulfide isomerase